MKELLVDLFRLAAQAALEHVPDDELHAALDDVAAKRQEDLKRIADDAKFGPR